MCGRYVIARAAGDLLGGVPLEEGVENYNVAPTATVPVLVDRADTASSGPWTRELHAARWGLLPRWAENEAFSSRTFNARSETAAEKPAFRHAAKAQHCAVPANGYYEWRRQEVPGRKTPQKTPYFVHPADPEENIYFAGLYDWWRIPEGPEAGQWLLSVSILTMDAPTPHEADGSATLEDLGALHDRLPIPLDFRGTEDDGLSRWLRTDPETATRQTAEQELQALRAGAYPIAATWRLREVGPEVGSVRNNGPDLVEPVERLL